MYDDEEEIFYFDECPICREKIPAGTYVYDRGGQNGCICEYCAVNMEKEELARWAGVSIYQITKDDCLTKGADFDV